MGCTSSKNHKKNESLDNQERGPPRKPLRKLKRELQEKLKLEEDHHFTVFVQYEFWKSYRRGLNKFESIQLNHLEKERKELNAEERAGIVLNDAEEEN